MNVERQKQAFIRAGVHHALEICREPRCYVTEEANQSSGDCWWAPREWFKRVFPLARCNIVIPGYRRADEYSDYGDGRVIAAVGIRCAKALKKLLGKVVSLPMPT